MRFKSSIYSTIAALALVSTSAFAAPVQVSVANAAFQAGPGYGVDATENTATATLLDVQFITSGFVPTNFTLNSVGDSVTFSMGKVNFLEPTSSQGIHVRETDGLDLTASLTFTNPLGYALSMSTSATVVTGSIQDSMIDLSYTWLPYELAFGDGGRLQVALQTVSFANNGSADQMVKITYVQAANAVPEPASLALMGLGLAGLGLARRRRS